MSGPRATAPGGARCSDTPAQHSTRRPGHDRRSATGTEPTTAPCRRRPRAAARLTWSGRLQLAIAPTARGRTHRRLR